MSYLSGTALHIFNACSQFRRIFKMLQSIVKLLLLLVFFSYGTAKTLQIGKIDLSQNGITNHDRINKIQAKKFVFDEILEANQRVNMTNRLYEGDIILNPVSGGSLYETLVGPDTIYIPSLFRNARGTKWSKSNDGLVYVPYILDEEYSSEHRATINEGFDVFANHTCIRFVPNTVQNQSSLFIESRRWRGCSSFVGRQGRVNQSLFLHVDYCIQKGIILHELMHAIGFEHEQSRSDRDQYVRVIYENVDFKKWNSNFHKYNDTTNLVIYDYTSIMHYSLHNQAIYKFLQTMEIYPKRNPEPQVGFRYNLSPYDIEEVKYYYDCSNGTYKRCGKDFVNEVSGSFQSPLHSKHYPSEAHCTWNITVPPGRFVEVSFTDVDLENSTLCQLDAVILHNGINANASVFRRICGRIQNLTITSTGNSMFIIFTSNANIEATGFQATFQEVTTQGSPPPPIPTAPAVPIISPSNYVTEFQCKFDSDYCGMTQDTLDDLDFQINTRTTATGTDMYLYLEASPKANFGDNAIIRTPWFKRENKLCVQFSYSLYGNYVGGLRIYAFEKRKNNKYGIRKLLWEKFTNQAVRWKEHSFHYSPDDDHESYVENVQFYWEGYIRNKTYNLGIDDIEVYPGNCVYSTRKCDFFVYFSKDPCRFQNVDENEDTYSWLSGTCESPTGPIGDHTSGNGHFLCSGVPRYSRNMAANEGDNAVLESPRLTFATHCFSLWYYIDEAYSGNLTVYKLIHGMKYQVAKVIGNPEDRWKLLRVEINTTIPVEDSIEEPDKSEKLTSSSTSGSTISRPYLKVIIEATAGIDSTRNIAIDDFEITDNQCLPPLELEMLPNKFICDFESGNDLCGLQQDMEEDISDWIQKRGTDNATGPLVDSTTNTTSGNHIFVSSNSFEKSNYARIFTPKLRPGRYCLRFAYHIYGSSGGFLSVSTLDGSFVIPIRRWIIEVDPENQWRQASYEYQSDNNEQALQFVFAALVWPNASRVVALDDIRILSGTCRSFPVSVASSVRQPPPTLPNGQQLWSGMPLCTFENKTTQVSNERNFGVFATNRLNSNDMGPYFLPAKIQNDNLCGWFQVRRHDNFDWTRYNASKDIFGSEPSGDKTTGKGYFIYLEPSFSLNYNDVAFLRTYFMPANDYCMDFNFHMTGFLFARYGKLQVRTISVLQNGTRLRTILLTQNGNFGNRWKSTQIDYVVPNNTMRVAFRLEGIFGSYRSHVAVDDVTILPGRCNACHQPSHRLISPSNQEQWFSTGCVHTELFYVRCCDSYPRKAVYRRVQNCNVNMFSSTQLNRLCQD